MIRKIIVNSLEDAVIKAGYKDIKPNVLGAKDKRFGDYYSNIVLKLSSLNNEQTPQDIANNLVAKVAEYSDVFETEISENQLINFRLKPAFVASNIQKIIEQGNNFGKSELGKGKKARVEFVSANPTGPLHIGNARGGPLGDTIAAVLSLVGFDVLREYLDNDRGNQVYELGKAVASKAGLIKSVDEDLAYSGEYVKELALKVKNQISQVGDKSEKELALKTGEITVKLLFKDIISDLKSMGINYDLIVHESELQKELPNVLEVLEKKKLLRKFEGAVWFTPNNKYLIDKEAVVVKSDGSFTYFAADIAYHIEKFERSYDLIIDVFGSNTSGHVPKLKALVKALGKDEQKLKIILYQFVRVKKGNDIMKMSKRAGNFIAAKDVLDTVGKDAFRFFLLMHDPDTHMDFDVELAKQQSNKNPVYYIQYAHARCSSILKNAQKQGFSYKNFSNLNYEVIKQPEELELLKILLRFPEIIEDISGNFQVHLLPSYAKEIAEIFHKFYEKIKVIQPGDSELTMARLGIIQATKIVLGNLLRVMGISAPEAMEKKI